MAFSNQYCEGSGPENLSPENTEVKQLEVQKYPYNDSITKRICSSFPLPFPLIKELFTCLGGDVRAQCFHCGTYMYIRLRQGLKDFFKERARLSPSYFHGEQLKGRDCMQEIQDAAQKLPGIFGICEHGLHDDPRTDDEDRSAEHRILKVSRARQDDEDRNADHQISENVISGRRELISSPSRLQTKVSKRSTKLKIGDHIVWRSNGCQQRGIVKWIGILPNSNQPGETVVVEGDNPTESGTGGDTKENLVIFIPTKYFRKDEYTGIHDASQGFASTAENLSLPRTSNHPGLPRRPSGQPLQEEMEKLLRCEPAQAIIAYGYKPKIVKLAIHQIIESKGWNGMTESNILAEIEKLKKSGKIVSERKEQMYQGSDLDKLRAENRELREYLLCRLCKLVNFTHAYKKCGHAVCDACRLIDTKKCCLCGKKAIPGDCIPIFFE